jgi:hypothetical protein
MRPVILLLALGAISVSVVVAGQKPVDRAKRQVARVDSGKPTVYLALSTAKGGAQSRDSANQLLRFELHNNTKWTIYCYLIPAKRSHGDFPVAYKVEEVETGRSLNRLAGDVFGQKAVSPGSFVTFRALPEHLAQGRSIYVEFNYDWEVRDNISPYGVEPNHRVYFSHADLR